MRLSADRRSLLEDIRRQEGTPFHGTPPHATPTGHASNPRYNYVPATSYSSSMYTPHAADVAHSQASQRYRLENGRALLRDALSYERPSERMRIGRDTTVPTAPESIHYQSAYAPRSPSPIRGSDARDARPRYLATPPDTSGGSSEQSPAPGALPVPRSASFTPGFAPAHRSLHEEGGRPDLSRASLAERDASLALMSERLPALRRSLSHSTDRISLDSILAEINLMRIRRPHELTPSYLRLEASRLSVIGEELSMLADHTASARATPPDAAGRHEALASAIDDGDHNPLQRMRPRHWPSRLTGRVGTVDGLGDRERSFSPEDFDWESLLVSIPPDERVPSAHSSFTSASASASAASSSSQQSARRRGNNSSADASQGTLITAPSSRNGDDDDDDYCPTDLHSTADLDGDEDEGEDVEGAIEGEHILSTSFMNSSGGNRRYDRVDINDQQRSSRASVAYPHVSSYVPRYAAAWQGPRPPPPASSSYHSRHSRHSPSTSYPTQPSPSGPLVYTLGNLPVFLHTYGYRSNPTDLQITFGVDSLPALWRRLVGYGVQQLGDMESSLRLLEREHEIENMALEREIEMQEREREFGEYEERRRRRLETVGNGDNGIGEPTEGGS